MLFSTKNRGFVLIVVLSLLSLLTVLTLRLTQSSQIERNSAKNYLNKIRSRMMALSGVQFALAYGESTLTLSGAPTYTSPNIPVGAGSYDKDKDTFQFHFEDSSGRLNLNDGIEAGALDTEFTGDYSASELNPWGDRTTDASGNDIPDTTDKNLSGLINLRLRRLLNAYGDAHRFQSQISSYGQSFVFTSTAYRDRNVSIPEATGLGDTLILNRPEGGYGSIQDVQTIVNTWAANQGGFPVNYLNGQSFFEKIKDDLTVNSQADTQAQRLKQEPGSYANHYDNGTGEFVQDVTRCNFQPRYLDTSPLDLTEADTWAPHAVIPVNLNSASKLVRAAVFYAPTNVSYLCEGAVTHTSHQLDHRDTNQTTDVNGKTITAFAIQAPDYSAAGQYVKWSNSAAQMGMSHSSIGVRGPCFRSNKLLENGVSTAANVQANRFMSLRDALELSDGYDAYVSTPGNKVMNFQDFGKLLKEYRTSQSPTNIIYERSEVMDASNPYFNNRVQAIFEHDVDGDPVWVSQYWFDSLDNAWKGGYFLDDYVERSLPHLLSNVRRIPGCLGAPLALTSPYMIVEPFAYHTNLNNRKTLTQWNAGWNETQIRNQHLGKQPKISVEDLVYRQTLPKVCFLSTGIYDISTVGSIHAPDGKAVASTTIRMSMKLFQTQHYRSQKDILKLIKAANDFPTPRVSNIETQFVVGPEFTHNGTANYWISNDFIDNHASGAFLSFGIRDCNSRAGFQASPGAGTAAVPQWDLYLDGVVTDASGNRGLPSLKHATHGSVSGKINLPEYDPITPSNHAAWLNPTNPPTTGNWRALSDGNTDFVNYNSTYGSGKTYHYRDVTSPNVFFHTNVASPADPTLTAMEEATTTKWAAADGHDLDPFAGGIFFSQNGHGEWAVDESSGDRKPFRDSLFWYLNTKLKSWDNVDPTSATYYNYPLRSTGRDNGYPTGVSFHRGFAAAWFRVPTAYPYAQPVYYRDNLGLFDVGGNPIASSYGIMVQNKTQMFRCIFSLNLNQGGIAYAGGFGYAGNHMMVGYHSGFTEDSGYDFEHGITGYYFAQAGEWHKGIVGDAFCADQYPYALYYSPTTWLRNGRINWNYPDLPLSGILNQVQYSQPNDPWESVTYSYEGLYPMVFVNAGGYSGEAFYPLTSNPSDVPGTGPGQEYDQNFRAYRGNTDLGAHRDTMIKHSLPMNTTPECGPGSWHRIYAFWFFRYNPGHKWLQDGNTELPGSNVVGDSTTYPDSTRYASEQSYDFDQLDQFGIWFRDDSNFTDNCANSSELLKPQYSKVTLTATGHDGRQFFRTNDPNMNLTLGGCQMQRMVPYDPVSGEGRSSWGTFLHPDYTATHERPHHFGAHRLESSVDDFIFAYGAELAPSRFPNCFYNARWLLQERGVEVGGVITGHTDETRYDVRTEPEVYLGLSDTLPVGSEILAVGSRIYEPRDTYNNYSRVDVTLENAVGGTEVDSSDNNHHRVYSGAFLGNGTHLRLKYRNANPDNDPLDTNSVIAGYDAGGLLGLADFDHNDGDSFTNAPYIQEITVRYIPGDSIAATILTWSED